MAYSKLFSSITESSLWGGSKEARILFVSMLARCDQIGFIEAAVPGLARMANLTIEEVEAALDELGKPDKWSKSPDAEGRRVTKVERGWCLVNYEAYRNRRDEEERREYMRTYMAEYRKNGKQPVNKVNSSKPGKPQLANADAAPAPTAKQVKAVREPQEDLFGPDQPTPPAAEREKTFGDFQAMHANLHVGREERETWVTTLRLWGWEPMSEAYAKCNATLKDPKHRVLLSMITKYLDANFTLDPTK